MIGIVKFMLAAVAGLALGLWVTRAALSELVPIAVDRMGGWRLEARAGAADADPYTRARVERDGDIPLSVGEGVRLTTREDSQGHALDAACLYRFGPRNPPARYWTLEAIDRRGYPIENADQRYVLRSTEILRDPDGGFTVWISATAHSGNWLPIGAHGRFALALRLYDAALSDASIGERAAAPILTRERCL